jgi:hypothetical protein
MRQDDVLIIKFIDVSEQLAALSSFVMKRIQQTLRNVRINQSIWRNITEWGYAVAQSVEALRYKPEGRGFDSQLGNWNFSVT